MVIECWRSAPNFELPDTELKMRTLDEFKGVKRSYYHSLLQQVLQFVRLNYAHSEIHGKKFQI